MVASVRYRRRTMERLDYALRSVLSEARCEEQAEAIAGMRSLVCDIAEALYLCEEWGRSGVEKAYEARSYIWKGRITSNISANNGKGLRPSSLFYYTCLHLLNLITASIRSTVSATSMYGASGNTGARPAAPCIVTAAAVVGEIRNI